MTFPSKLLRLQIGGSLYGTEQWSMGFHFTTMGSVAEADGLASATENFLGALSTMRHETAKLGFIKFNELDHQTGHYSDTSDTNAKYYVPEHQPSSGSASKLPQGAICVTLGTAKQRGRGHAGRVFLPGYPGVSVGGRMTSGDCGFAADAVATYINAITLFDPGLTAVVWSKIDDSVTPITHTRVGDIVDTQRRRRGQLAEVYTQGAVAVS